MARPKRLVTAALTFTTALAIGFAMQYGDAIAAIFTGSDEPLPPQEAENLAALGAQSATVAPLSGDVDVAAIVGEAPAITPEEEIAAPIVLAAAETVEISPEVIDAPVVAAEPVCDVTMSAVAVDYAMVDLSITADCFRNASFVMHHQGMMFSASTDADGTYNAQVPALAQDAFFIAAFDNGEGAIAQVNVPTLAQFDRAVLQWQGSQSIYMHAREFGAAFGAAGHISAEIDALGEMAGLADGAGGYLQRFGTTDLPEALMAEVYTFPSGVAGTDGDVALSAEIEITDANCGREVTAQSLQIFPGADTQANDLVMKMPACDTVGEFLVLKNMFEDLKLASR